MTLNDLTGQRVQSTKSTTDNGYYFIFWVRRCFAADDLTVCLQENDLLMHLNVHNQSTRKKHIFEHHISKQILQLAVIVLCGIRVATPTHRRQWQLLPVVSSTTLYPNYFDGGLEYHSLYTVAYIYIAQLATQKCIYKQRRIYYVSPGTVEHWSQLTAGTLVVCLSLVFVLEARYCHSIPFR